LSFPKASPELGELLDEALIGFDARKKPMFGAPVWFVHDNMFSGVFGDNIFVRLSDALKEDLFTQYDEAAPFEPMPGRAMRDYAVLPEEVISDRVLLQIWLTKSFQHVSSLPIKEKKSKKK
jgi:hypothetical protein